MIENDISYAIRGAAFNVHTVLGPGLLESSYEAVLAYELRKLGHEVKCQVGLPLVKLGLLINFNVPALKDGIVRIVNNL